MPKSDFNKVAKQLFEIILWHECSPVNLLWCSGYHYCTTNSGSDAAHGVSEICDGEDL